MKITSTIRALQLITTGLILLAFHFAAAQAVSNSKEIIVLPCTPDEFKVSTKPEFRADNHDTYINCEALEIHWLPGVHILRFHSPVHTDYDESVSVIKIGDQPMQFIQFLSGPMASNGDPNKAGNILIMNSLMDVQGKAIQEENLTEYAKLFLFLIGADMNFKTNLDLPSDVSILDLVPEFEVSSDGQRIDAETIKYENWKVLFDYHKAHWRFYGFNEKINYTDDELKIDEKHPYPNQLPGYELYENYIAPLVIGSSSMMEAEQHFGKGERIDNSAKRNNWSIEYSYTCNDDDENCSKQDWYDHTLKRVTFTPIKPISFSGLYFSKDFSHGSGGVSEINILTVVYTDDYGLEYWLHASDSKYGKKGDLYQIVYKAIEK